MVGQPRCTSSRKRNCGSSGRSTRTPKLPLKAWAKVADEARWEKPSDIAEAYLYVGQVGKFTVFNIGGNKSRLIVVVHFNRGKLFVRHVLTHEEHGRGDWKER